MNNKQKAEATFVALQERKRAKARVEKDKERISIGVAVESIARHKGRKNLKYFY